MLQAQWMRSQAQTPQQLFAALAGRSHFQDLLTASTASKEQFMAEYMPMAERLAMCVQDLPLAPDVFKAQGGALQAGLQAGLLAVRSCDATIFEPKATAQERQKNAPLFRWCAYCSALASVYLICAGHVQVVLPGDVIFSFAGGKPLSLSCSGEFLARWSETQSGTSQAGLIYLQSFFYPGQFIHLNAEMLTTLGGSINPALTTPPNESPLGRVVRTSIVKVLEAQRQRDSAVIVPGTPVEMVDVGVETASPGAAPVNPLRPAPAALQSSGPSQPSAVLQTAQATPVVSAPVVPSDQVKPDPFAAIPPKVLEWVKALANIRAMDAEVTVDDKGIRFGRKALGFGATPKDNYTALYEAKVVLDKGPDFARCNRLLARAYCEEKDRVTGGKS